MDDWVGTSHPQLMEYSTFLTYQCIICSSKKSGFVKNTNISVGTEESWTLWKSCWFIIGSFYAFRWSPVHHSVFVFSISVVQWLFMLQGPYVWAGITLVADYCLWLNFIVWLVALNRRFASGMLRWCTNNSKTCKLIFMSGFWILMRFSLSCMCKIYFEMTTCRYFCSLYSYVLDVCEAVISKASCFYSQYY